MKVDQWADKTADSLVDRKAQSLVVPKAALSVDRLEVQLAVQKVHSKVVQKAPPKADQ